jgi:hypothetical protein
VRSPAPAWNEVCEKASILQQRISRSSSINLNNPTVRAQVSELAKLYFREAKGELVNGGVTGLEHLDTAFVALLKLSDGQNPVSSYRKWLKVIRSHRARVLVDLEVNAAIATAESRETTATEAEELIAETLEEIAPSAALSYRQAMRDLADAKRVSFRGPALELREALREVLDNLAPDEDVLNGENFKLEAQQTKPTMRQKVQFVLRARGRTKTEIATPKDAADAVEGLLGTVARSIYNQGSLATHTASGRSQVLRLKRYVDVILSDLLEL